MNDQPEFESVKTPPSTQDPVDPNPNQPPASSSETVDTFVDTSLVKPIGAAERYTAIDALRGFTLLGILVPNIVTFAWPLAASNDPAAMGDTAANFLAHDITSIVFLGKFMFLFALLFGSGVIMYARKYEVGDTKTNLATGAALWYRRCGILLVFGLIHAYLFWWGDILTTYAICGLTLLWWVRRLPPKLQIFGGLGLYLLVMGFFAGLMFLLVAAIQNGSMEAKDVMPDTFEQEIEGYRGSYLDALYVRAQTTVSVQITMVMIFAPALCGVMCFGMGLTRTGILTGEKSTSFYLTCGSILLPVGWIATFLIYNALDNNLEYPLTGFVWQSITQPLGIPISLGYAAFVIAIAKTPALTVISKPLAAVGRMALTNYFLHTLLCTTFFYGYGLGYFGTIAFPDLWIVVFTVWAINIIFSMIWLKFFKMGPFEWVWRTATYGRIMSFQKS